MMIPQGGMTFVCTSRPSIILQARDLMILHRWGANGLPVREVQNCSTNLRRFRRLAAHGLLEFRTHLGEELIYVTDEGVRLLSSVWNLDRQDKLSLALGGESPAESGP